MLRMLRMMSLHQHRDRARDRARGRVKDRGLRLHDRVVVIQV